MDMYIDIYPPRRRNFRIYGSERELGDIIDQITRGFGARGGVWLVWAGGDESTWVPAGSTVEFNWDVRQVVDDHDVLSVVAPLQVEVLGG